MKKNNLKILSALVLSTSILSTSAQAGFFVDGDGAATGNHSSQYQQPAVYVTQKGMPYGSPEVISGFGKQVNLVEGLKQILPQGWHAKKEGDVNVAMLINWRGARAWPEILQDVARDNKLSFNIDWDAKMLTVSPYKEVVNKIEIMDDNNNTVAETADAYNDLWHLKSGKSLRQNIEAWAAKTNPKWVVSWGGDDYPIMADAELHGELTGQNGVVAQLIQKYAHAEKPLSVTFYEGNHVIRVENRVFKQQEIK